MAASGLFLVLYGLFRIVIEFVREPDRQLGYIALGWVTTGMLLSLPMVIAGVVLLVLALRNGVDAGGANVASDPPHAVAKKARRTCLLQSLRSPRKTSRLVQRCC